MTTRASCRCWGPLHALGACALIVCVPHADAQAQRGSDPGLAAPTNLRSTRGIDVVEWDPVPLATGYRLLFGEDSALDTGSIDVGDTTTASILDLADEQAACKTWYVAVRAYDATGESPLSNTVSGWPAPHVSSVVPGELGQGEQSLVSIDGDNFQPGLKMEIISDGGTDLSGNPLMRLQTGAAIDCHRYQALIAVEPLEGGFRAAQVGFRYPFALLNPDGSYVGPAGLDLGVLFDPARIDINRTNATTRDRADGYDLTWLRYAHATYEGEPRFNPDADLDGGGFVDGDDLALFASRFGDCWTGTEWTSAACAARDGRTAREADPLLVDGLLAAAFVAQQPREGEPAVHLAASTTAGSTLTLLVNASASDGIYAVVFDLLFDPQQLEFAGWARGELLERGGHTPNYLVANPQAGRLVVGASRVGQVPTVDATDDTVIELRFRAIARGASRVEFEREALLGGPGIPLPIGGIRWHGGLATARAPASLP